MRLVDRPESGRLVKDDADRGGWQERSYRTRPAAPTTFYWKLTILACLGGFLFGYDTSNIGAALNFVPYHLNGFWTGYLVAGASLGAAAGAVWPGRSRTSSAVNPC